MFADMSRHVTPFLTNMFIVIVIDIVLFTFNVYPDRFYYSRSIFAEASAGLVTHLGQQSKPLE